MAHSIPQSFQDAYRRYVSHAQKAFDEDRGFVPLDRVILNQPLAQLLQSVLCSHVDLDIDDKVALI